MKVSVGFSQGTSIVGRIVCRVTHADVSHVFFLVEDDDGGRWAYEAAPARFRRMPFAKFEAKNHVKRLVVMDWPHETVKCMLDKLVGQRYPLARVFMLGLKILLRGSPGRSLGHDATDCVSSTLRVLGAFGLATFDAATPAELDRLLQR